MEMSYDIWTGESLGEIIDIMAKFRVQVFLDDPRVQPVLSDEINFLQYYLQEDALVVVANGGGQFVGYMAMVGYSDVHQNCSEYSHYGPDLVVTEGPIVHPDYWGMGVGRSLMRESFNECELRDKALCLIDTKVSLQAPEEQLERVHYIADAFQCDNITGDQQTLIYKKEFNR